MSNEFLHSYFNKMNNFELPSTWAGHREELKKIYGISEFFNNRFDNSLIIGAGNMYDLPYNDIVNKYKTTSLLDIDKSTLKKAINTIDRNLHNKVELICKDIVGYPEKISKITSQLIKENPEGIKELLSELFHYNICSAVDFQQKYSLVISSTVSSQLILPITEVIDSSYNNELIVIAKKLGEELAEKHANQVWSLIHEGGIGILASEQYAWGYVNNKPLPLTNLINSPEQMLDNNIQKEIEKVKGGLTINGRITSEAIQRLIPQRSIVKKLDWIWQFDNSLFYLVKCWVVIKE